MSDVLCQSRVLHSCDADALMHRHRPDAVRALRRSDVAYVMAIVSQLQSQLHLPALPSSDPAVEVEKRVQSLQ